MTTIKRLIGMPGVSPVLRTAIQGGLAVLVAAGLNWIDVANWKAAGIAAGAAAIAKLQELSRG